MLKAALVSAVLGLVSACGANSESSSLEGANSAAQTQKVNLECRAKFVFTTRDVHVTISGFTTGSQDEVGTATVKLRRIGKVTTQTFQVNSLQTKAFDVYHQSQNRRFLLTGLSLHKKTFDATLNVDGSATQMVCTFP